MKYSNANLREMFRLNYTKVLCLKSIFVLLISGCTFAQPNQVKASADKFGLAEIKVGAEQTFSYFPALKEKRVAVVGNQSSLIGTVHLVDTLIAAGVKVKKVFSPEHGFRGDADAGEHVKSGVDEKTGLPVISLYGSNKKPTQEQLKGIDVVIFDIQDVGVRFYTYISTLHYVMEACAEAAIPVIILDRPNPNAHYVDGPVLDMKFSSFVGMHPVPIVYGMTIGEYGKMINGEQWLEKGLVCDLRVVPCENYMHSRTYSLPVAPSPNLRSDISVQLYPSLCLLEGTTVTVGRGTDGPFERFGHPDFPKEKTTFAFTPVAGYGAKDPKYEGKMCYGFNLNDSAYTRASKLDLSFLITSNELLDGKAFVDRAKFFNLLAGNDVLIEQLSARKSEEEIRASWKEGLEQFKEIRRKYLIYHD